MRTTASQRRGGGARCYVMQRRAAAPGRRGEAFVLVREPSGKLRRLDPRLDLANHSPSGFEWGYAGSGPAQLALAILADALGDDGRALQLYQRFKSEVVAQMPADDAWELPLPLVVDIARQIERSAAA